MDRVVLSHAANTRQSPQFFEGVAEFGAASEALTICPVLEDRLTAKGFERLSLAREVLRLGADTGVAEQSRGTLSCVTQK